MNDQAPKDTGQPRPAWRLMGFQAYGIDVVGWRHMKIELDVVCQVGPEPTQADVERLVADIQGVIGAGKGPAVVTVADDAR